MEERNECIIWRTKKHGVYLCKYMVIYNGEVGKVKRQSCRLELDTVRYGWVCTLTSKRKLQMRGSPIRLKRILQQRKWMKLGVLSDHLAGFRCLKSHCITFHISIILLSSNFQTVGSLKCWENLAKFIKVTESAYKCNFIDQTGP